ncbi:hypothetical protein HDU96_002776, partial [Phlyctochytrium bullatum]
MLPEVGEAFSGPTPESAKRMRRGPDNEEGEPPESEGQVGLSPLRTDGSSRGSHSSQVPGGLPLEVRRGLLSPRPEAVVDLSVGSHHGPDNEEGEAPESEGGAGPSPPLTDGLSGRSHSGQGPDGGMADAGLSSEGVARATGAGSSSQSGAVVGGAGGAPDQRQQQPSSSREGFLAMVQDHVRQSRQRYLAVRPSTTSKQYIPKQREYLTLLSQFNLGDDDFVNTERMIAFLQTCVVGRPGRKRGRKPSVVQPAPEADPESGESDYSKSEDEDEELDSDSDRDDSDDEGSVIVVHNEQFGDIPISLRTLEVQTIG